MMTKPFITPTIPQGQFVAKQWQCPIDSHDTDGFTAFHAETAQPLPPFFYQASLAELALAGHAARDAAGWYSQQSGQLRADLLNAIADELSDCPHLLARLQLETGLALARLQAELQRTTGQLRAFAASIATPTSRHVAATDSTPALWQLDWPLGPVAVFAASNFPLAFSVAGGDTAAALAAGCPVIVKAHPAHPGGSALTMLAVERAMQRLAIPVALVQLLQSSEPSFSHAVAGHPAIAAVSFTGSKTAGLALAQTCQQRPIPIPCFGELGAVNPQVVLTTLSQTQRQGLADSAFQAITGSGGQLCTKPGLWLIPAGAAGDALVAELVERIDNFAGATLLGPSYLARYESLSMQRSAQSLLIAQGHAAANRACGRLWSAEAATVLASTDAWWQQEIFGPCAQIIRYQQTSELVQLFAQLEGQLAVSLHGELTDDAPWLERLAELCGRLLYNQLPTGVLVHPYMMHGGPFPASTNPQHSAVGLAAMRRFVRPLCIQAASLADAQRLALALQVQPTLKNSS